MQWVFFKIVYFMFSSFSDVKNAFRNSRIKNLSWFGEFSDDSLISHRNSIQFDEIHKIKIDFGFIINLIEFQYFFDDIPTDIRYYKIFRF